MSVITWIILVLVLWRMIVRPMFDGYRTAGNRNANRKKAEYTDYEEVP